VPSVFKATNVIAFLQEVPGLKAKLPQKPVMTIRKKIAFFAAALGILVRLRVGEQCGPLLFAGIIVFARCEAVRMHAALPSEQSDSAKCTTSFFMWNINIDT